MLEEESFVRHIRADPEDEVPRLVYADYLEERGDPRGELIRIQCELGHLPAGDPRRLELIALETELLDTHAEAWLAPLRALGAIGISPRCFQRGLTERVKMEAGAFVANCLQLCSMAPALSCVELCSVTEALEPLSAIMVPRQITSLSLNSNRLGSAEIARLTKAPWFQQLGRLDLAFNELGDDGVLELARIAPSCPRRLSLGRNGIGPRGVGALAALPELVSLALPLNSVGPGGARSLARSSLAKLEELDLAGAGIQSQGALELVRSRSLTSLRRLNLRKNGIEAPTLRTLVGATHWKLDYLDLRSNAASPELKASRAAFGGTLLL